MKVSLIFPTIKSQHLSSNLLALPRFLAFSEPPQDLFYRAVPHDAGLFFFSFFVSSSLASLSNAVPIRDSQ